MDPKAALEGTTVIPAAKPVPAPAAVDTSRFVSTDQFGNALAFSLELPAQLA